MVANPSGDLHEFDTAPVPGHLIRLLDVPGIRWLPRKNGKKLHRSVPFRWVQEGLRGIRLRVIRAGGTLCTTEAWLREFFDALTDANPPSRAPSVVAPTRPSKSHEHADAALRAKGF